MTFASLLLAVADQMALMTPGNVDLNFMAGHKCLATVSYIFPCFVRWRGWCADARLIEPAAMAGWLRGHGFQLPEEAPSEEGGHGR